MSDADGLNRAQRTAVTTLSGPLLVLAGAGTGKTRVITFRIAELIKSGIKADRILAVTFTNKAAKEMRERAMHQLGRRKKKQAVPEISTFHSLCVRVLRRHATRLGYPAEFTIYDRGDQESIARGALRDIRVGLQKLRPGDLINMISGWKSQSIKPHEAERVAKKDVEILAAMAYGRYQAALRASGAMDFDDLLLLAEQLFMEHPEARYAEASRYDHLLIDEYQDTNGLQYRIVKHLADRHRNLCVVGDDDQSIYGWRGAEVQHILNFKNDWPEARVVRLEENYRSTEWVLKLANTLIAHNKTRHDKVLCATRGRGETPRFMKYEDEEKEAENIVREIHGKINREDEERVQASKIAILFRTNEQPRVFELELRRAGVPYMLVGGQSFYDRKEIKDLLGYLRVLANPNDEVSLLRIINTPSRGIGTGSIQAMLDKAVERGQPLWKLLPEANKTLDVSVNAAEAIENFRLLIDEYRARIGREKLSEVFRELVSRIDYKSELDRQYKDASEAEARWNAVEELVNSIATYETKSEDPSLLGYLEETALTTRDDQKDDDDRKEHSITLMTLHSAKGLEFPHVYLVGMEEGLLPHKRSVADGGNHIDEERRLAYVGVTRAQDTLCLSLAKNRMKWGKLRPSIPSRFLLEMRGETEKANEIAALADEQIGREVREARQREEEDEGKPDKKKKRGKGRERAEKSSEASSEKRAPKSAEKRAPKSGESRTEGGAEARAKKSTAPQTNESPQASQPRPAPKAEATSAVSTPARPAEPAPHSAPLPASSPATVTEGASPQPEPASPQFAANAAAPTPVALPSAAASTSTPTLIAAVPPAAAGSAPMPTSAPAPTPALAPSAAVAVSREAAAPRTPAPPARTAQAAPAQAARPSPAPAATKAQPSAAPTKSTASGAKAASPSPKPAPKPAPAAAQAASPKATPSAPPASSPKPAPASTVPSAPERRTSAEFTQVSLFAEIGASRPR